MKNRLSLLIIFALAGAGLSLQAVTTTEKQGIVLKVADYSKNPETLLFTTHGAVSFGNLVKAKVFIDKGFVPVRVIVHNKRNEPIKISANSVGDLADMERVFQYFRSSKLVSAAFIAGLCAWITGFVSIVERNDGYWWYPVTSGAVCLTALLTVADLYSSYQYDKRSKQCLEQHILNKSIVIPPHGRIERLLLFDINNRPMSLDFDIYDLHDSVIASFKKISLEDEQHDEK